MRNSRILFIVEGENDEVAFVRQLLGKCYANHEYDIYSYRCNIHVLAQILFDEYPFADAGLLDQVSRNSLVPQSRKWWYRLVG